jgi:NADH-quinone oxidoreductase subunit H
MVTTLFFGGWDIPFTRWDETPGVLQTVVTGGMMFLKVFFWLFLFMWIRWTLPRFRYDQLMALGWRVFLPISLAYVMLVALVLYLTGDLLHLQTGPARLAALVAVNLVLGWFVFVAFDRGLLISGSRGRRAAAGGLDHGA